MAQETKTEVAAVASADAEADADASFDGMEVGSRLGATREGMVDAEGDGAGGRGGSGSLDRSSGSLSGGVRESSGSRGSGSGKPEGCWPRWRAALQRLVHSKGFQRSIMALIVLNTLILAMDHHPLDDDFSTVLEAFNLAFTVCFTLEMAIKVRTAVRTVSHVQYAPHAVLRS